MNLPPQWTLSPDGTYRHSSIDQWLRLTESAEGWFVKLCGATRPTQEEAERDAERLLWALEPAPDREEVALGLVNAVRAHNGESLLTPPDVVMTEYWQLIADTAIRLLGGQPNPTTPPKDWPKNWECFHFNVGPPVMRWNYATNGAIRRYHYLPSSEDGRLAAHVLNGWRPSALPPLFACPSHGRHARGDEDGCCQTCGMALIGVGNLDAAKLLQASYALWEADHNEDLKRDSEALNNAVESRNLADKEVEALRALLKTATEETAELRQRLSAAYRPAPPYDPAFIKPLAAWLACAGVHEALADAAIHAVEKGTVTADQAIEARRDPVAMARLILEIPEPFEVPF